MAMLATLEGPEVVESDDYILGRMFSPNDGLGVELLGVDGWNIAKNKVANAARKALRDRRLFIVPEIIYFDPTPCKDNLADVLFGIDENYCNELLGFSITKNLKKAASGAAKAVKSAVKSVSKKVSTATLKPVTSARKTAKAALKEAKKYTSPKKALQLTLSPTLQTKAISKADPTGISTAIMDKGYKMAPDVLPSYVAEKSTEKTVKYDPTGISQKLYKAGKTVLNVPEKASPSSIYSLYKKTRKTAAKENAEQSKAVEPVTNEQQAQTVVYEQESSSFDWSTVINWKTFLIVGGAAYFIFGRGKRRGRK